MRFIGLVITGLALALPLVWFVPLAAQNDPSAIFSQYIGSTALIAMGISQLFATRMKWLEAVWGGLDRIYVQHKWLGIGAMVAVLLHDTIDADVDGIGRETWLTDLAETLGEVSLYGLLILVVITITTFIPYHLWRWTHKLMGAFFAMSAFHYLFILKPFSNFDPVGLYVSAFCVMGILAYVYTLLPERIFHLSSKFKVSAVERTGEAIAITLSPEKRGISHKAGQFAFVSFDVDGLTETHPYTISKASDDIRSLRFTIKPLGDHTNRLARAISVGTKAHVKGAFGHFRLPSRKGSQIWIAGGIGITPFAAWAQDLKNISATNSDPIHLFYCVRDEASAAHIEELRSAASKIPNFNLHCIESGRDGRLNVDMIEAKSGVAFADASAAFCGPELMRKSLKTAMVAKGLPAGRFAYEEFEIRSGIGLTRLINWIATELLRRTKPMLENRGPSTGH